MAAESVDMPAATSQVMTRRACNDREATQMSEEFICIGQCMASP